MPKSELDERFDISYKQLNTEQKKAVDSIEGPVMVVAGPGTGKTTLLTLRIANILRKTDIQPDNILALTFTNAGVHAMREKLLGLIGDEAYKVQIFTFHSFAEHVIKQYSSHFEDVAFGSVISDLEKIKLLESIIEADEKTFEHIISRHDVFSSLRYVRDAIATLKQEGVDPEECLQKIRDWNTELMASDDLVYKRKTGKYSAGDLNPNKVAEVEKKVQKAYEVQRVYAAYQEKLQEKGVYDFSDMILTVLNALETNEDLKLDLAEQYQYILVDEHQDTNDGQNKLIEYLTDAEHLNGRPNIMTVGDEKQSIYRFQGASEKTFRHFESLYQDVQVITLKENYRSNEHILSAAHGVITHTLPDAAALSAHAGYPAEQVLYREFSNNKLEVLATAKDIENKIAAGTKPEDIAVIYHANKHVEDIKKALQHVGVPYTVHSNDYLLEHHDIQYLISLIRIVDNPMNSHELGKLLFANFLGFDPYHVTELLDAYYKANRATSVSLFTFLQSQDGYADFCGVIKELQITAKNEPFMVFLSQCIEKTGYLTAVLQRADSQDAMARLDKLFDEVQRQVAEQSSYGTADFLHAMDAYMKYGIAINVHEPEIIAGVALLTAHRSKGLEFEHVYMLHTTRSNWEKHRKPGSIALPVSKYVGDEDDERRLFYVAMTRAKATLTISSAETDWEGRKLEKSQFVSEIVEDSLRIEATKELEQQMLPDIHIFLRSGKQEKGVFDVEYLKELFLQRGLNVTALNNYVTCPIEYLFKNLIRIPSPYVGSLVYGDAVHNALELFFKKSKQEEQVVALDVLLEYFQKTIAKASLFGSEYERYLERGQQALTEYYHEYSNAWSLDIDLEISKQRMFPLDDEIEIKLSGRLDKVEYVDGADKIHIVDYKTGKPFSEKSSKQDKEALERQLAFYYLLYETDEEKAVVGATLDFIEKGKQGQYEQHSTQVTSENIEELKNIVNEMSKDVMSGEFLKQGCGKKECEHCALLQSLQDK